MKYTVILKYPDYMTDGIFETRVCHTEGDDACDAIGNAQLETQKEFPEWDSLRNDFDCAAVFKGHLIAEL